MERNKVFIKYTFIIFFYFILVYFIFIKKVRRFFLIIKNTFKNGKFYKMGDKGGK